MFHATVAAIVGAILGGTAVAAARNQRLADEIVFFGFLVVMVCVVVGFVSATGYLLHEAFLQ